MDRAKRQGRARYAIFNPDLHARALQQLRLENDLRRAIEQQEFTIDYQSIANLQTGYLVGFEALIRWQHPTQGRKSPAEFIPLAKDAVTTRNQGFQTASSRASPAEAPQLYQWLTVLLRGN